MDLIYTCYRSTAGRVSGPARPQAGSCLTAVSPHNWLLFTTSSLQPGDRDATWHVYCTDLNTPWAAVPVCALEGEATCLAWDGGGERFLVADSAGQGQVWERGRREARSGARSPPPASLWKISSPAASS